MEIAQHMAIYESARMAGLYDRRNDHVAVGRVEMDVVLISNDARLSVCTALCHFPSFPWSIQLGTEHPSPPLNALSSSLTASATLIVYAPPQ